MEVDTTSQAAEYTRPRHVMDGETEPHPPPPDPVARWVAEGLRDVEIAVRLNVSVGEARERRARLHGEPHTVALPRPWPPAAAHEAPPEPEPATAGRGRWLTFLPAAVLAALTVAGGWWLLSAGSEPAPRRTVETFLPLPPDPAETAIQLQQAASVPFPDDLSLVMRVEDGADGAGALERLYRDAQGELRRDRLLVAPEGATIGRVVADVDGWLLVAGLHAGDSTSFLRSDDGGVSWQEQGSLAGQWEPVGVWEGETVAWRDRGRGLGEFVLAPSGEAFVPPYPDGSLPLAILAKGKLLWRAPGSGVIAEGDRAPYASPNIDQGSYHEWLAPQPTGAGTMISWSAASAATGEEKAYAGIMTRRGQLTQSWVGLPGPIAGRRDGATLVSVAPSADAVGEFVAVLVELQANRWSPIAAGDGYLSSGEERFIASVRQGPFVRVRTRRDCSPILGGADIEAVEIGCVVSGVILRAPGETVVHNDYTWTQVVSPSGRPGWIRIDFLEQ